MKKTLLFILSTFLIFSACRKDEINKEQIFVPVGTSTVESALSGQVVDEEGKAVRGATVTLDGQQQTTNGDGYFRFPKTEMLEDGAFLTVENSSYFTNYKRIIPTTEKTFSKIGLIKKGMPTGSFNSAEGGTISKPDGEIVTFGSNTIVDKSGNVYNGNVQVYTHHFDPENANLSELMPGDLLAVNADGNLVQLVTYSMVMVELIGDSGQELNLKEGTTATIQFPLKGAAAAVAPNEIPLWSFDETNGLWIEEGTATKDGNYYTGEVSHFSFWNCDAPFPLVNLKGRLVDEAGNPIQNLKVTIMILSNINTGSGYSNSDGIFSGKVPANEQLFFRINSYCQSIIDERIIGPFSADEDLGDIVLEQTKFITITGKALECSGGPIQNGYVAIKVDGLETTTYDLNGSVDFQITVPVCSGSEVMVYVTNLNGFLESQNYAFTYSGQATEDTGEHTACSDVDEFVYMKFGGQVLYETDFDVRKNLIDDSYYILINRPTPFAMGLNQNDSSTCFLNGNLHINSHDTKFLFDFELDDTDVGGYVEGRGVGFGKYLDINTSPPQIVKADLEVILRGKIDELRIPISGRVWNDLNKNGLMESNEPPLSGVEIISREGGRNDILDTTNADGYYTNLYSSTLNPYFLFITPPSGFVVSPQDIGSDDTIDSDFFPVSMNISNLLADPNSRNIFDCGLYEE